MLELRKDVCVEVVLLVWKLEVEVSLEIDKGQFVPGLKLGVLVRVLLDGVVGQMNECISAVLDRELAAARSNIALLIPVGPDYAVGLRDEHVAPEIELPAVVEEGAVDVELHNVGLFFAVGMHLLAGQDLLDFLEAVADVDAVAAVGDFPGLDNPDVSQLLDFRPVLLPRVVLLVVVDQLLLLQDLLLPVVVELEEILVLAVVQPLLDVEGDGNVVEEILLREFVVLLEIVEHGLLVAEVPVELEVVVALQLLRLRVHRDPLALRQEVQPVAQIIQHQLVVLLAVQENVFLDVKQVSLVQNLGVRV